MATTTATGAEPWVWQVPSTVSAGVGATGAALCMAAAGLPATARRALVVSDATVAAATPIVERTRKELSYLGLEAPLALVESNDIAEAAALAEELRRRRAGMVVGVGGGRVMDVAKLAALALRRPEVLDRDWDDPCGLVNFPPAHPARGSTRPPLPSVMVPTTIGTGAEVSMVACLRAGRGTKLIMDPLLRPSHAALDPTATEATPRGLVLEGALELTLRCVGQCLWEGDPPGGSGPFTEDLAFATAARAVADADLVASRLGPVDSMERAARHRLALASASTHTGWLLAGRDRFGHKLWYLAHEVAAGLGTTKMRATAALLGTYLGSLASGTLGGPGTPERVARLAGALRPVPPASGGVSVATEPPALPQPGAARALAVDLLSRWALPTTLADLGAVSHLVPPLVERTWAAWGPPLPALDGLDRDAITRLYLAALEPHPHPGKEVNTLWSRPTPSSICR